jgi:hypothetical protein
MEFDVNFLKLTFVISVFVSTTCFAQTKFESAFVRFSGENRTDDMYSLSAMTTQEFIGEAGQGNLTQVTASGNFIQSNVPTEGHLGGQLRSTERRGSVGVDQTYEKLTSAGASIGFTGTSVLARWYSLRAGQWWNKATISTDFEYTKTNAAATVLNYLDTDGRVVVTPTNVRGDRYSLSVTWLATPRAMVLASSAMSTASNRPKSNSASIEGRYFVDETLTAIHLSAGMYEDKSQVEKNTNFGRVSAREWALQIHQHLSEQLIAAVTMRNHFETEVPRSVESSTMHRHGRAMQASLRHRFVTGPLTDSVPEVYLFTGQYRSIDAKKQTNHFGFGGVYVL